MKRLLILIAALAVFNCAEALAQDYVPTPVTVSQEKVKLNGKVYLSHVVLERQTVYGICKAYGVSEEALHEANPTLRETGLQKDAILLIPIGGSAPAEEEAAPQEASAPAPQAPQKFLEHTVRWYEDIDDIARRYAVSVQQILDANGLSDRKLSARQVLKIPVPLSPEEEAALKEEEEAKLAARQAAEMEVPQVDSTLLVPSPKDCAEFSLVLPLGSGELNMDFYSGVLMALKDLEADGIKARMHVYDLSTALPPIEELVKEDFVLGPVASRDIEAILQRVDGQVALISPLDQKAAALSVNYRNFVQAPSATEVQYEDLAAWLKEDLKEGEKVILITEKGASSINAAIGIRSAMAKEDIPYEILNYSMAEGRGIHATLGSLLGEKGSTARVMVASENEAFVGDAVRNIGIMQGKGYEIVMYAPSKVRTFDTIDGTAYHNASLHICSTYHVDYADAAVQRFVHTYRSLFRTEPSPFAFQGYDTARFFVQQVIRSGKNWTAFSSGEKSQGLHTDFYLVPDENGNLKNSAVRRVVFEKDYTTTLQR